ncbi:MAG: hypothetical protein HC942_08010 [Microcoleus sp. SU_5_6]|nr:hypothetical protein [Microcoleus sp. SU_5_6]NJL67644.1 hypothetical protein [Microcoleus sp. SM1_3_4]
MENSPTPMKAATKIRMIYVFGQSTLSSRSRFLQNVASRLIYEPRSNLIRSV